MRIFFFFLFVGVLWGQENDMRYYQYNLWLRPSINMDYLRLEVIEAPENESLKNKKLLPNYPVNLGFSMGIYNTFVTVGYSKSIVPLRDTDKYGKSKFFDFQVHSFFKERFLFDLYYQDYKGFYYTDKANIRLLNDTKIHQIGSELLYFRNLKEIALEQLLNHGKTQFGTAFGWYIGGGLYYHKIDIPALSYVNSNEVFRHIQAGVSVGVTGNINLTDNFTAFTLMGIGGYFGGEIKPLSKMKLNGYNNFRLLLSGVYTKKDWTFIFTVQENNKQLYYRKNEQIDINSSNIEISCIRQFRFQTKYRNRVMELLGM